MMNNDPLRDEDLALALDVESKRWKTIVFGIIRFGCFFVVFLGVLAAFTPIREVAVASGEITSKEPPILVEHVDGGLVHTIHVREGDIVEAGDDLITLVGSRAKSSLAVIEVRRVSLLLQRERLSAHISGRVPDFHAWEDTFLELVHGQKALYSAETGALVSEFASIEAEIRERDMERRAAARDIVSIEKRIANADERLRTHKKLFAKGFTTRERLLDHSSRLEEERSELARAQMKLSGAERAVGEAKHRLALVKSKRLEQWTNQIAEISASITELDEAEKEEHAKVKRLVLTAARHGVLHGLTINGAGEVISPGEHIAKIVPIDATMIAELRVLPSDIGHIRVGSPVEMTVTTFDEQKKGKLAGEVDRVSATTVEGRDGEPYYVVSISIEGTPKRGSKILHELLPGMVVHGQIITGEKSVMRYLLKPIVRVFSNAFSER